MLLSLRTVDRLGGDRRETSAKTHRRLDSWSPAPPDTGLGRGLTTAKTVAKVSVVSDTAGGRSGEQSGARRSTRLDCSSGWNRAGGLVRRLRHVLQSVAVSYCG